MVKKRDIYEVVGENIKMFRKKEGMNLEELSEKAGISISFLSNIEKGSRKPTLATVEKIATALNVGMAAILVNKETKAYFPEESEMTLNIMKIVSEKSFEQKIKIFNIIQHV